MISPSGRTGTLQNGGTYPVVLRSLPSPPDRALSGPSFILPANKRAGAAPGMAPHLGPDRLLLMFPRPAGHPGTLPCSPFHHSPCLPAGVCTPVGRRAPYERFGQEPIR
jgi:hypothetical protein